MNMDIASMGLPVAVPIHDESVQAESVQAYPLFPQPAPMLASEVQAGIEEWTPLFNSIPWDKVAKNTISIVCAASAGTLGVFTELSVIGIMMTPVGWGIAGGTLFLALAGSAAFGPNNLLKDMAISAASSGFGAVAVLLGKLLLVISPLVANLPAETKILGAGGILIITYCTALVNDWKPY